MPQNLIVVGFAGTRRATEVLAELQKLDDISDDVVGQVGKLIEPGLSPSQTARVERTLRG